MASHSPSYRRTAVALLLCGLLAPITVSAIPTVDEPPDTIVVCRDGTYLNDIPFTTESQADGHDDWPASATDLDPERFRNPEFRRIPQPKGFLVIQEASDSLDGEARLNIDGVSLQLRLSWNEAQNLHWRHLQASIADDTYLGLAMNSVYWRPSENLVGSALPRESLDAALENGLSLRFQDAEAHDHVILDPTIFFGPFESARDLCLGNES